MSRVAPRLCVLGWLAVGCGGPVDMRPDRTPTKPPDTDAGTDSAEVVDTTDTAPAPTVAAAYPRLVAPGVKLAEVQGGFVPDAVDAVGHGSVVVASWVNVEDDDRPFGRQGVLFVARSDDGGDTFGSPVEVPTPLSVEWAWPRRPRLAIDGARVAIALGGEEDYERSRVGVFVSSLTGELALTPVLNVGAHPPHDSLLYPLVAFGPDGDLWAAWLAVAGVDADVHFARESQGWLHRTPNGEADQPCDCCPIELAVDASGNGVLAWRGDYDRDVYVARTAPGGGFAFLELATTNDWTELICPRDGPRLAFGADASILLASTDKSTSTMQAWFTRRPEPGGPWAPGARPLPGDPETQTRPTLRAGADGSLWLGVELGFAQPYLVVRSPDGGQTWETPHVVASPGGLLHQLELVPTARGMRAIGLAEDEGAWFVDLEP